MLSKIEQSFEIEDISPSEKLKCFLLLTDSTYKPIKIEPININQSTHTSVNTQNSKEIDFLGKKRSLPSHNKLFEGMVKKDFESNINTLYLHKNARGKKPKNSKRERYITNSHTKYSDDNIIQKIKCCLLENCRVTLNKLLQEYEEFFGQEHFLKIKKGIVNNLKKNDNMIFLEKKIWEIFSENISEKYKIHDIKSNKELIKKILDDKNEKFWKIKEVLNLSFREILLIFLKKENECIKNKVKDETLNKIPKIDDFLEKIRKKENINRKNNEMIEEKYLKRIKELCFDYEQWFKNKISRKNKRKNNF